MEITEVRICPVVPRYSRGIRLVALANVTFDGELVVHNVKVLQGDGNGTSPQPVGQMPPGMEGLFLSMPAEKRQDHCGACTGKNPLKANYCMHCGSELGPANLENGSDGRPRLYSNLVHPLTVEFRARIEQAVFAVYASFLRNNSN